MEDFLGYTAALRKAKLGRMLVFGIFRPMVYMLNISSTLCLLYLGSRAHILGQEWFGQVIDSAVVVSFYMYIGKFFNPIQALAEQFDMLQRSFAAAEKIFSILDLEPQVVDEEDAIELPEIRARSNSRMSGLPTSPANGSSRACPSRSRQNRPWPSSAPPAPARPPSCR